MSTLHNTSRLQRFHFASFDGKEEALPVKSEIVPVDPTPLLSPLPVAPPALFSEKDIMTARADGQSHGYREGYAAAQEKFSQEEAAREESIKNLLEIIANRITLAAESHSATLKERETLMGKTIMATARKVAGDALKKEPYAAVEGLVRECMAMVTGAPLVTIVVSSALAPVLRQRIDMLKPMLYGFSGELKVEEDSALFEQDCRVEWGNGYGERNIQELWSALEAIIMRTALNDNTKA